MWKAAAGTMSAVQARLESVLDEKPLESDDPSNINGNIVDIKNLRDQVEHAEEQLIHVSDQYKSIIRERDSVIDNLKVKLASTVDGGEAVDRLRNELASNVAEFKSLETKSIEKFNKLKMQAKQKIAQNQEKVVALQEELDALKATTINATATDIANDTLNSKLQEELSLEKERKSGLEKQIAFATKQMKLLEEERTEFRKCAEEDVAALKSEIEQLKCDAFLSDDLKERLELEKQRVIALEKRNYEIKNSSEIDVAVLKSEVEKLKNVILLSSESNTHVIENIEIENDSQENVKVPPISEVELKQFKSATLLADDLKEQLALEKRRVSSLEEQVRGIDDNNERRKSAENEVTAPRNEVEKLKSDSLTDELKHHIIDLEKQNIDIKNISEMDIATLKNEVELKEQQVIENTKFKMVAEANAAALLVEVEQLRNAALLTDDFKKQLVDLEEQVKLYKDVDESRKSAEEDVAALKCEVEQLKSDAILTADLQEQLEIEKKHVIGLEKQNNDIKNIFEMDIATLKNEVELKEQQVIENTKFKMVAEANAAALLVEVEQLRNASLLTDDFKKQLVDLEEQVKLYKDVDESRKSAEEDVAALKCEVEQLKSDAILTADLQEQLVIEQQRVINLEAHNGEVTKNAEEEVAVLHNEMKQLKSDALLAIELKEQLAVETQRATALEERNSELKNRTEADTAALLIEMEELKSAALVTDDFKKQLEVERQCVVGLEEQVKLYERNDNIRKSSEEEVAALKSKVEHLETVALSNDELKLELAVEKRRVEALEKMNSDAKKNAEEDVAALLSEMEQLESTASLVDELKDQLAIEKQRATTLNEQNSEIRINAESDFAALRSEIDKLSSTTLLTGELEEQLAMEKQNASSLEEQVSTLFKQIKVFQEEHIKMSDAENNVLALETEISQLRSSAEIASANSVDCDVLRKQLEYMSEQLQQVQDQSEKEVAALTNSLAIVEEKRNSALQRANEGESTNGELKNSLAATIDERDALVITVGLLEKKTLDLTESMSQLRDELSSSIESSNRIEADKLSENVKKFQDAYERTAAQLEEVALARDSAYAEVSTLTSQLATSRAIASDLSVQLATARTDMESYAQAESVQSKSTQEFSELLTSKESLEGTVRQREERLKFVTTQLEEVLKKNSSSEERAKRADGAFELIKQLESTIQHQNKELTTLRTGNNDNFENLHRSQHASKSEPALDGSDELLRRELVTSRADLESERDIRRSMEEEIMRLRRSSTEQTEEPPFWDNLHHGLVEMDVEGGFSIENMNTILQRGKRAIIRSLRWISLHSHEIAAILRRRPSVRMAAVGYLFVMHVWVFMCMYSTLRS